MIDSNIENLSEPFRTKFKTFLSDCKIAGLDVRMGEGRRTPETQLLYFLQGRISQFFGENKNLLAEYHALRKRVGLFDVSDNDAITKKITWTLNSNHFNGNAADVLVYINGNVNWNPGESVWEQIAVIAEKNGLASGHRWPSPKKDSPHIELKGI
jgi:hypothetical protein